MAIIFTSLIVIINSLKMYLIYVEHNLCLPKTHKGTKLNVLLD